MSKDSKLKEKFHECALFCMTVNFDFLDEEEVVIHVSSILMKTICQLCVRRSVCDYIHLLLFISLHYLLSFYIFFERQKMFEVGIFG